MRQPSEKQRQGGAFELQGTLGRGQEGKGADRLSDLSGRSEGLRSKRKGRRGKDQGEGERKAAVEQATPTCGPPVGFYYISSSGVVKSRDRLAITGAHSKIPRSTGWGSVTLANVYIRSVFGSTHSQPTHNSKSFRTHHLEKTILSCPKGSLQVKFYLQNGEVDLRTLQ